MISIKVFPVILVYINPTMRLTHSTTAIGMVAAMGITAIAQAEPQQLKRCQFITYMAGNTLSGETDAGTSFNVYFLTGGAVTYEDEAGDKDNGSWRIDSDDNVCVTWQHLGEGEETCYFVTLDDRTLSWRSASGSGSGTLRGTIAETFLNPK